MVNKWPISFVDKEKKLNISRHKTYYGANVHTHEKYVEVEYILSGSCRQNIANSSFEMTRGDVAFFEVNSRHEYYAQDELEILRIVISPEFLPPIYKEHKDEFQLVNIIDLPANEILKFENILFSIEKEFNEEKEFYLEIIAGYLDVIFSYIIRYNRTRKVKKTSNIDFKIYFSFIENNLQTVTPRKVAAYSSYNFPYFSKMFKKHVGVNLSEYINIKKLEKAQKLLLASDETLESIAYKVGFNHKSYFHRIFKEHYGVTPDAFRKKE